MTTSISIYTTICPKEIGILKYGENVAVPYKTPRIPNIRPHVLEDDRNKIILI